MLVKMKLMSYEDQVQVDAGDQKFTIAHGQEMDIESSSGKITITGTPPAKEDKSKRVKTPEEQQQEQQREASLHAPLGSSQPPHQAGGPQYSPAEKPAATSTASGTTQSGSGAAPKKA